MASISPAADLTSTGTSPEQMVGALHSAFGDHHSRAVHAKGVMAVGTFEPSSDGPGLSKAALFMGGPKPVLARFSDFTGIPEIPDTANEANPRGLALKFTLAEGSTVDVVNHSFNGFPTATAAEFRELLLALAQSGSGAAQPTALDRFLAAHPIAKTFLATQKPAPESYASLSYFGVNAFTFINAEGKREHVRYRFVPLGGEAFLSSGGRSSSGPNYLQQELPARLAKGPIGFEWYAQIAEASDAIDDPSIAWPESRRQVKLGVIRLTQAVPDPAQADRATMFAPLNVPTGIEPADPMLIIRQSAYPLSFQHRQ